MPLFHSERTLQSWLDAYAVSHQNLVNKRIHWVCVPTIFLTIVALLAHASVFLIAIVALGVLFFYWRLSKKLFAQMSAFMLFCLVVTYVVPLGAWFWFGVFVIAWIGQFVGHKIEGAKPSFFEDLQFLLIGPAWVVHTLFAKIEQ